MSLHMHLDRKLKEDPVKDRIVTVEQGAVTHQSSEPMKSDNMCKSHQHMVPGFSCHHERMPDRSNLRRKGLF